MRKMIVGMMTAAALVASGEVRDPAQTTLADVRAALAKAPATHPRLFATAADFEALRARIKDDAFLRAFADRVILEADRACTKPALEHKLVGFRLLGVARDCLARVTSAAMAWRLTGEAKYRDAVRSNVDTVLAFPDWNPRHFLDVAEFSLAVSIAYDWLYDCWDAAERAKMEQGLLNLGIAPSFAKKMFWVQGENNWSSVCHAGLLAAALSVKDVAPARAEEVILRAIVNLKRPAAVLAPHGNYPEGPGYWGYGVGFHILAIDMLEKNLGTAFGLSEVPGWAETIDYRDLITGPTGKFFNYSDGSMVRTAHHAVWWFAQRYNRPDILVTHAKPLLEELVRGKDGYEERLLPLALLWYRPIPAGTVSHAPLTWESGGEAPLAVQRTGWGRNDLFVALKAGTPSMNHGHMDGGTFVLDALGVRWAYDLGAEGYYNIEKRGMSLWSSAQNSDRWNVYRLNNFSHNTLVLDGSKQLVKGFATVSACTPGPGSSVTLDLTPLYTNATGVTRTGTLRSDGTGYLLEDRVEGLRPGAPIRWAMMTRAKVKRDGTRLVLSESGKQLVLEPVGGTWDWQVEEQPKPNEWDSLNKGYRQITFTLPMPAQGAATFGVFFRVAPDPWKPGSVHHGFTVRDVQPLPEVKGRLIRMDYLKNGAQLAWLDRPDDNKTFAIGFRTFPEDDTGVPHIIEHSVLCGSEKYPVKEPFTDLLKSSFATFLNAFTSQDATMYPVCSRNSTDFLNLMDVYLDAVFHPLSVKTPLAFRQEGWHWQLAKPEDPLTRNGIVYSEMKGAFSNPDRTLHAEMNRLLYPNTCYGYVSGGDPASIPTLTFDGYRKFYARHYHPANARIFLDGTMDVEQALAKLDGFLAPLERRPAPEVKFQTPVTGEKTVPYEIGPQEDPVGKVLVADGWVCGRFDERTKYFALDVLADALAGDNESPLKKTLLEKGLCEDVSFGVSSHAHLQAVLTVKNVKDANVAAVRTAVRETLARLAAEGLDHARLAALIDRAEFHDREKDYGGYPRGLAFYMDAVDIWHYGGNPADAFRNASRFDELRQQLAKGGFERLLKTCFLENPHHAQVRLNPDPRLAETKAAAEKAACARVKAGWSKDELARVVAECQALTAHQTEPDRPEDAAKLPRLALKDIPREGPVTSREVTQEGGVTLVRPHTAANGVLHLRAYFAASDLTENELLDLPILGTVLGELATKRHPIGALRNALDGRLGSFGTSPQVVAVSNGAEARAYFTVGVSALASHAGDVQTLVPEVLLETDFADTNTIGRLLQQKRLGLARAANGLGARNFAYRRASAQVSPVGALDERLNGFVQLRHLQALEKEDNRTALARRLAKLAGKLFVRNRLTLCVADNTPASFAASFAKAFPRRSKAVGAARETACLAKAREGFRIPGAIASAACVARPVPALYDGKAVVAARILSLDYLWDEIRVKGGAYGGNFRIRPDGLAGWLSWNDPQPARSLGVYARCGEALAQRAANPAPIDRFVVSAVAATEPYLTPRMELAQAGDLYLSGRTPADLQRRRAEMLDTTKDDLRALAAKVTALAPEAAVCVVGGVAPLAGCTNRLDRVEGVQ